MALTIPLEVSASPQTVPLDVGMPVEQVYNSDYDALVNKPQINGVTLVGNNTAEDLGLQPDDIFIAKYGITSFVEIEAALTAGKTCFVQSDDGVTAQYADHLEGLSGENAYIFTVFAESSVVSYYCDEEEGWYIDSVPVGSYTKPPDGIPASDLAQDVQTSLSKADSALQDVPSTYRTAAAQDVIDDYLRGFQIAPNVPFYDRVPGGILLKIQSCAERMAIQPYYDWDAETGKLKVALIWLNCKRTIDRDEYTPKFHYIRVYAQTEHELLITDNGTRNTNPAVILPGGFYSSLVSFNQLSTVHPTIDLRLACLLLHAPSSVVSEFGTFRLAYATKAAFDAIPWQTSDFSADYYVTNRDFVYIVSDESHNGAFWCYQYLTGTGWTALCEVADCFYSEQYRYTLDNGAVTRTRYENVTLQDGDVVTEIGISQTYGQYKAEVLYRSVTNQQEAILPFSFLSQSYSGYVIDDHTFNADTSRKVIRVGVRTGDQIVYFGPNILNELIADHNIARGEYFSAFKGLFQATTSIASGSNIVPGTNCTELEWVDELGSKVPFVVELTPTAQDFSGTYSTLDSYIFEMYKTGREIRFSIPSEDMSLIPTMFTEVDTDNDGISDHVLCRGNLTYSLGGQDILITIDIGVGNGSYSTTIYPLTPMTI